MDSLWHSVVSSLLMAWLLAAFAWGVAGAALASWARLPLWTGVIAGAAFPVLGVAVLALVVAARHTGRDSIVPAGNRPGDFGAGGAGSGSGGWTSRPAPTIGAPDTSFGGFGDVGTPWSSTSDAWGSQFPAGAESSWTSTAEPASYPDWGLTEPAVPFGSATASVAVSKPSRLALSQAGHGIVFGVLALGALATLFVNSWVRISATSDLSFSLNAWDLGLGQMMLVTFLEFASFAVIAVFRRTRWLGVLAVFAGTWWLLLWWVAVQVGGGVRHLVRNVEVREVTLNATYRLGPVWSGVLALGVAMTAWGLFHLITVHAAHRSGR
jgi:hypothetical protein